MKVHQYILFTAYLATILFLFSSCDKELPTPVPDSEPPDTTSTVNIENLKINEIQTIGSHNSYRLKTYQPLLDTLLSFGAIPGGLDPEEWDYTHETLPIQFDTFGIRSVEIDIHHDPQGGLFYNRQGNAFIPPEPTASNEPELLNPGVKVLHVPDLDYLTNYLTFISALNTIKSWSDIHPNHLPLIIMIELKTQSIPLFNYADVLPFTATALDSVDMEIETVFGPMLDKVITPDDLKGAYASVNEAVMSGGWPTLGEARGKVIFVAMASSTEKTDYMIGHPGLSGRAMFVFSDAGMPETAFIKYDDPVANQDTIQKLVQLGYMVRTRTDAGTWEARSGDYSRMNLAFSSGAQIISTDYYRPDARADTSSIWTNYSVSFPNKELARLNPENGPSIYVGKVIGE